MKKSSAIRRSVAVLMIASVFPSHSALEKTNEVPWCCIHGVGVGPCITYKKEEYYFDDPVVAESECDAWSFDHTDPDVECNESLIEPFFESANREWPRCDLVVGGQGLSCGNDPQPIENGLTCDSSQKYTGVFYYSTCPDKPGFFKDVQNGCIQEDEPQQCTITVGNPLNIATGSKYHSETIDTGNQHLGVTLNYTSNYRIDRFGKIQYNTVAPGWNTNHRYEISSIKESHGETFVIVKRPDGRNIRFDYDTNTQQWGTILKSDGFLQRTNDGWQFDTDQGKEFYVLPATGFGTAKISYQYLHNGMRLSYEYTGAHIRKITDSHGNYVSYRLMFTTNVGYRIHDIEYSDGRKWLLDYHPTLGNLESITYPDGSVKKFYYDDPHVDPLTQERLNPYALTGYSRQYHPDELDPNHPLNPITEGDMRFASYEYDAERRVINEYHHAKDLAGNDIKAQELTIAYNQDNTRTVTNSKGKSSTYEVERNSGDNFWQIKNVFGPGCTSCGTDNSSFVYDNNNNLISKTKDGITTVYGGYDSKGQYAYKIEAFGTVEEKRTEFEYDSRFVNKVTKVTEDSIYGDHLLESVYKITNYDYNDFGQMTSMSVSGYDPNGRTFTKTTSFEYNGALNQISSIDGPRPGSIDVTTFDYYGDSVTPESNRNQLQQVTGPEGIVERSNIQWSATGKVIQEDRPNGITLINTYDFQTDRLNTVTQSDGVKSVVTKFTYLKSGLIESVVQNYATPEAKTLTLTYDDAFRVTRVTDNEGNYIEYALDTEGNETAEKIYDLQGALKMQITRVFDDFDMIDTESHSGVAIDYNYSSDGLLKEKINGNSVKTDYNYDNLKRLIQVSNDHQGSDLDTANTNTNYEYDKSGNLKKVIDSRGNSTTYSYDDLDNLITLSSPDSGITTYSYDEAGNMLSKTDAKGTTVVMTYDGRNRITSINYTTDSLYFDNSLDVSFLYDQGTNGVGHLTSMIDQTGATNYAYDAFGNLINKTQMVNGFDASNYQGFNSLSESYSYDANNQMVSMTYPSGLTLNYEYDELHLMQKISTTVGGTALTVADQIQYLPFGPITSISFGSGKHYTANYDNGYRLLDYGYGSDISALHSYDGNHNIARVERENSDLDQEYYYDALDRLIQANSVGSMIYKYDKLGNRTRFEHHGCPLAPPSASSSNEQKASESPECFPFINILDSSIDPNSNQLLQVGSESVRTYDENGNMVSDSDSNKTWIYNEANRMSQFNIGNKVRGKYYYNGVGQRVHKSLYKTNGTLAGEFLFVYDQQGQLIHSSKYKNGKHIWDREVIWLGNRPIARVDTKYSLGVVSSQNIYYIQTDHLNTPRWITDDSGTRIWSWESDAFGSFDPEMDVDGDGNKFWFYLRFPGQYYDQESGLHHNYFRDYDPDTGRYVQSDPIGLNGGMNTYNYVDSRPNSLIDPLGLMSCVPLYEIPSPWRIVNTRTKKRLMEKPLVLMGDSNVGRCIWMVQQDITEVMSTTIVELCKTCSSKRKIKPCNGTSWYFSCEWEQTRRKGQSKKRQRTKTEYITTLAMQIYTNIGWRVLCKAPSVF